ncbi:hypothetical protein BCV69DRAFT_295816 [Microstroma glucosiphilum]|uniref:Uncharacterized protein n=1 Tax=Pseudomicrostroma glucosiphilum TaxID=1684307 RepID=A0A316UE44_9BASI|nr:hypothetical protein BCV69DRAFT_295816 [Pseudomicrostroma glucosiphilum]PWN23480.1 hypothetical protein BCV69DRAFT_295816 [Pseudomicrostroma glucosiphilum]
MPLLLPPLPSTSADVSDEALCSLEPSTLLLEAERLQNSILKLEESNAALQEFVQGGAEGEVGEVARAGEGERPTKEEEKMFEEVRRENEEVIARQNSLLARIQEQIEAQGGAELARNSDPHLVFGAASAGRDGTGETRS